MKNALNFVKQRIKESLEGFKPDISLTLGSGLGEIADSIEGIQISYADVPGFVESSVSGHAGKLAIGKLCNKNIIAMQGRFHYYEGIAMETVIYPVRLMKQLGVKKFIVTNAAGGINTSFKPGDLMIINDHINLTGSNPLIGKNNDSLGPRFVDMSNAYNKDLISLAQKIAENIKVNIQNGVYAGVSGPTYETPAEVKMLRALGADAVGMSTVFEVIAANHAGMEVLGISCITNMASGILDKPLSHNEVLETGNKVKDKFSLFIKSILQEIQSK